MTRDDMVTEIRHHADAESEGRWAPERVLTALNVVMQREWRNILNSNRYYRTAVRTVTPNSAGEVALTALNSGSGDTLQTLYRILAVYDGDLVYKEIEPLDAVLLTGGGGESWAYRCWYRSGENIKVIPAPQSTINVLVNYLPPLPSTLTGGTVELTYPLGYEQVPALETAAILLSKGGTETEAASYLKGLAEEIRRDMLSDIARTSTNPLQVRYGDSRSEWGA